MPLVTRQQGMTFAGAAAPDQAARLRAIVDSASPGPRAPAVPESETHPTRAGRPRTGAAVISVASGKGGVGKTNLCVNLSIALTELGRRTILVDADLGMANADVLCGLTPSRRLESALSGGRGGPPLRAIAVDAPGGFRLVPGALGVERIANPDEQQKGALLEAIGGLEGEADLVLVDTGAGLGRGVTAVMRSAHTGLVVVTPEPTSMTDAYALIKCIRRAESPRGLEPLPDAAGSPILVVNQARDEAEARSVHARLSAVCERFLASPLPLLGWIAQDVRVGLAVRARRPVLLDSPGCLASRQIRALALALVRSLRPLPVTEGAGAEPGGLRRLLSALMLRGG